MSISTVVTRGYGSWGTVNFLPPHGYASGNAPPPPTIVYIQKMDGHQRAGYPLGFAMWLLTVLSNATNLW